MAVIIDDVWDLERLDKLGLLLDCKSSHMVTSREVVPATSMYVGFNLTGKSNSAQEQAILASSLAKDPSVNIVQPHLQVQLHFVRCCHTCLYIASIIHEGLCQIVLHSKWCTFWDACCHEQ
jgi:hypothetical protein